MFAKSNPQALSGALANDENVQLKKFCYKSH